MKKVSIDTLVWSFNWFYAFFFSSLSIKTLHSEQLNFGISVYAYVVCGYSNDYWNENYTGN